MDATPLNAARWVKTRQLESRDRESRAMRERSRNARKRGVQGPLTRAELARRAA